METFLLAYICIGVGVTAAALSKFDPPLVNVWMRVSLIFGWLYFVIAAMWGE